MAGGSWFDERGPADAILEITLGVDSHGDLVNGFTPHGLWFGVPLRPTLPSPNSWDCRIVIEGLELAPGIPYLVDAYFVSPEEAPAYLPQGGTFEIFPGRVVGHGAVVKWNTR